MDPMGTDGFRFWDPVLLVVGRQAVFPIGFWYLFRGETTFCLKGSRRLQESELICIAGRISLVA